MKTHSALVPAALAALFATVAAAQDSKPAASGQFVLEAGETSVADLIDSGAAYLGCNILAAPNECAMVPGIRLQQAVTTDKEGCLELLANLLFRSGLALTVLDEKLDMYEVILMNGQRGREIVQRAPQRTPLEILSRPRLKMAVITAVPLEHINATIATNALRPFFASTGGGGGGSALTIGNVGNASSILIAGMQDQVAHAIRLLKACDVEQPPQAWNGQQPLPDYVTSLAKRIAALEKKLAAANKSKGQTR